MKSIESRALRRFLTAWKSISLLAVGYLVVTMHSSHASKMKEVDVKPATTSTVKSPGLPPIDQAIPSTIETASFGLG